MKQNRHRVAEQKKAQEYFMKSALFDDFHAVYTSIELILSTWTHHSTRAGEKVQEFIFTLLRFVLLPEHDIISMSE
jgi:hypothetical protein